MGVFRDISNGHFTRRGFHPYGPYQNRPLVLGGLAGLTPGITANGQTVLPEMRYYGGDADLAGLDAWGYGDDLIIVSTGTDPTIQDSVALNPPRNIGVEFNIGKYYQGPTSSVGSIIAEDMILDLVYEAPTAAATRLLFQKISGGAGWSLALLNTNAILFGIRDSGDTNTNGPSVLTAGQVYHIMAFRDATGGNADDTYTGAVEVIYLRLTGTFWR